MLDVTKNYSGSLYLLRSDYKYFPKSGMGSFWTFSEKSLVVEDVDLKQEDIDTSNIVTTEFKHPTGKIKGCRCADVKNTLLVQLFHWTRVP